MDVEDDALTSDGSDDEFGGANASTTTPLLPPSWVPPRQPVLVGVSAIRGGYSAQIRTADGLIDPETRVSQLKQRYRQFPQLVQQLDAEVNRQKASTHKLRMEAQSKARAAKPASAKARAKNANTAARAKARQDAAILERDRATDAASKRQQRLANRHDKTADDLLFELHASGAAFHTANSRHLHFFDLESGEYKQISSDVAKDLNTYARVGLHDQAECVRRYADRAKIKMKVCAACGLRDPEKVYKDCGRLQDLRPDHWMCVPEEPLARLDSMPPIELCKRGADGTFETVRVRRRDLLNLHEFEGKCYHVVPEAVYDNGRIDLCPCCASKAHGAAGKADRCAREDDLDASDRGQSFSDLYSKNAPVNAIAHASFNKNGSHYGDFGRLSELRKLGVPTDASILERMTVADARCHKVVYKIVAYGNETERRRLHGHTIVRHLEKIEPAIDLDALGL